MQMEKNSLINVKVRSSVCKEQKFAGTFVFSEKGTANTFKFLVYENCHTPLKKNQVLDVNFFENGKAYSCSMLVNENFDPEKESVLNARVISTVTESVRRVHCRHSCHLALEYSIVGKETETPVKAEKPESGSGEPESRAAETGENTHEPLQAKKKDAFISDISAGGMRIICSEKLLFNQKLMLSFYIPSEGQTETLVRLTGTVVSSKKFSEEKGTCSVHVRFDNVPFDTAEIIIKYVFRLIRQENE